MHELVEPQRYFSEKDQNFILFMSLEALCVMTIHASMHRNEVIGFLSGYRTRTKGPQTKKEVIVVTDCNPCSTAQFTDSSSSKNTDYSKNVEMDPESATLQVKIIESKGQSLVGWYHSHPKFEVNPSHIDVINHEMYQKMFNEDGKDFIGVIISPYYSMPSDSVRYNALPKVRCFVTTMEGKGSDSNIIPYECVINVIPQKNILKSLLLEHALSLYKNPFATDQINLNKEVTMLKSSKSRQ